MEKRQRKRILFAQNFLKNPHLVRELVGRSSIGAPDTVYEIGAGKGIITAELARVANKVVGIEKDQTLARRLRERFRDRENVDVIAKDFLEFPIAERGYKIFANIPYNMTAAIVRKILFTGNAPAEAYLILQKEAARKFSGRPRETLFSVLAKPQFEFDIVRELRRTDFEPMPAVESVLLHIKRRPVPLLSRGDTLHYREFVTYGFGGWKKDLKTAFKHVFTYSRWKQMARELQFPLGATPTDLSFEQWLGVFRCFLAPREELSKPTRRKRTVGNGLRGTNKGQRD